MLTITSNDIFATKNKTSDKCHLAKRLVMVSHLFGVSFYMGKFIDYTGHKFGFLTVVKVTIKKSRTQSHTIWQCRCECGRLCDKERQTLLKWPNISCGCKRSKSNPIIKNTSKKKKHGKSKSVEFATWGRMINRCCNPNFSDFRNYGGRGIKVCDRWLHSFETFLSDMGERPTNKTSLDRINVDGDYSPENCRWADWTEQGRNRRNTKYLSVNGVRKPIVEWAAEYNIAMNKLQYRLDVLELDPYTALTKVFRKPRIDKGIKRPFYWK